MVQDFACEVAPGGSWPWVQCDRAVHTGFDKSCYLFAFLAGSGTLQLCASSVYSSLVCNFRVQGWLITRVVLMRVW